MLRFENVPSTDATSTWTSEKVAAVKATFETIYEGQDGQGMLARPATSPVRPGMRVSAEIRTGERRVIEFLLSPVVQAVKEAARER